LILKKRKKKRSHWKATLYSLVWVDESKSLY